MWREMQYTWHKEYKTIMAKAIIPQSSNYLTGNQAKVFKTLINKWLLWNQAQSSNMSVGRSPLCLSLGLSIFLDVCDGIVLVLHVKKIDYVCHGFDSWPFQEKKNYFCVSRSLSLFQFSSISLSISLSFALSLSLSLYNH